VVVVPNDRYDISLRALMARHTRRTPSLGPRQLPGSTRHICTTTTSTSRWEVLVVVPVEEQEAPGRYLMGEWVTGSRARSAPVMGSRSASSSGHTWLTDEPMISCSVCQSPPWQEHRSTVSPRV
jgi:hypothetical protein